MHARCVWCGKTNTEELKAKRAFRGGAITVRGKKRACGNFNFQIYENVSREHESSVKIKRVSRIFLCVSPCSFHVRSALAFRQTRAAGIHLKAISRKYMRGAIALFLTFSKRVPEASRPRISTFMHKAYSRLLWGTFIRITARADIGDDIDWYREQEIKKLCHWSNEIIARGIRR